MLRFTSLDSLSSTRPDSAQANQADLIGEFVAGWGDPGLHPETFWLGYATGPAAGMASRPLQARRSWRAAFISSFMVQSATNMGRLYQLMSEQAQFWEDSWETGPSAARITDSG